jgi:hypothetical protein
VVAWSSTALTTGFVTGHRAPATTNNRRVHRDYTSCVTAELLCGSSFGALRASRALLIAPGEVGGGQRALLRGPRCEGECIIWAPTPGPDKPAPVMAVASPGMPPREARSSSGRMVSWGLASCWRAACCLSMRLSMTLGMDAAPSRSASWWQHSNPIPCEP